MHRTNGAGNVGGMFVAEDAAINRPPTEVTADWLNTLQEELAGFVEWSGQVLNIADNAQLIKGLVAKFATLVGVQTSAYSVALAAGSADAIIASYTPAITALADGMVLYVRAAHANATAAPTFSPGAVVPKVIVKHNGLAVAAEDIAGAGHWLGLQFDAALDKWVLLNPAVKVVTSANDPTGVDNSSKVASTGWIRGSMEALAASAGFVISATPNGYIRAPIWFGSLIAQWGTVTINGITPVTWPVAFPNTCWAHVFNSFAASGPWTGNGYNASANGCTAHCSNSPCGFFFIAVGR